MEDHDFSRRRLANIFPHFPWDTLEEPKATATAHPDGLIDLSIGTPVDPVAPSIQLALADAAAEPGYPPAVGSTELREDIAAWLKRRHGVGGVDANSVVPVVGTKEAIALLPTFLGIRRPVIIPETAYPTYEVAGLLAGCEVVRGDDVDKLELNEKDHPGLIFINSPSNPTGEVLGLDHLCRLVAYARENDAIIASDECYIGLNWDDEQPPVSILDPRVTDGDNTNLLAIHSLSKSSNLAGYRAGFLAGDAQLIGELTEIRKHTGLMIPGPVQNAMRAALNDDDQEYLQRIRYARRRAVLLPALINAGFEITHSTAGLYLWATRGENGRDSVAWLAERGILVAPGDFYGPSSTNYVRVSLTATDEQIEDAARRLSQS